MPVYQARLVKTVTSFALIDLGSFADQDDADTEANDICTVLGKGGTPNIDGSDKEPDWEEDDTTFEVEECTDEEI